MPRISASPALARFRILDLTRVRAGPTCVRHFADFGADVIKIESTVVEDMGGPRDGPDFQNLHRNKRSMTLNLKAPEGREIFMRLVKTADVVVENYRPDVKDRLGIDYESLKRINRRIVLASVSGFGQEGPYRLSQGPEDPAVGFRRHPRPSGAVRLREEPAGLRPRTVLLAEVCGKLRLAAGLRSLVDDCLPVRFEHCCFSPWRPFQFARRTQGTGGTLPW